MYYYDVAVLKRLGRHQGLSTFTYQSKSEREVGELVRIPFGKTEYLGVVYGAISEKPPRKLRSLSSLPDTYTLPRSSLELANWMSEYYATPLGTVLRIFVPPNLLLRKQIGLPPSTLASEKAHIPPQVMLNAKQKQVVAAIGASPGIHVIHGVTGSGKTHIYIHLAQQAIAQNKHVLILVPEIALTAQLVEVFEKYFHGRIHIQHSNLLPRERRDLWIDAQRQEAAHVWLGTRSSLFLPLKSVGLIILDEFHDSSYKQTSHPTYHAATVAARAGQLAGATVIFGSASPSVRDLYTARHKGLKIHKISTLVHPRGSSLQIIDLRRAPLADTTIPWLSAALEQTMHTALGNAEQVLLFLNRRGNATQLRCRSCGWHMKCSNCMGTLVYHEDQQAMRCHGCGLLSSVPLACLDCGAPDILLKGYGTKEVEKVIKKRFSQYSILRFDQDSLKADTLQSAYQQLKKANILIGTQLLAKGFDLPSLTTVGIIDADTMLQLPDFSAAERTFQLLMQVIGRAGRRGQARTVLVQTYKPDHPVIEAASREDYGKFYEYELEQRRIVGLPPFSYLLKLQTRHASSDEAARRLQSIVDRAPAGISFLGPAPAFHERISGQSQWQLSALSNQRERLVDFVKELPLFIQSDLDPVDLL